jgi:hypothetical protein
MPISVIQRTRAIGVPALVRVGEISISEDWCRLICERCALVRNQFPRFSFQRGPHNSAVIAARAGYPVRRGLSMPSLPPRNTGSPAFAGDDGRGIVRRHDFSPSRRTLRPHPQPRAQSEESTRVSHHRFTGTPGISCAMVLTAYFVISPVTGLFCHRHFADHLRKA